MLATLAITLVEGVSVFEATITDGDEEEVAAVIVRDLDEGGDA